MECCVPGTSKPDLVELASCMTQREMSFESLAVRLIQNEEPRTYLHVFHEKIIRAAR